MVNVRPERCGGVQIGGTAALFAVAVLKVSDNIRRNNGSKATEESLQTSCAHTVF